MGASPACTRAGKTTGVRDAFRRWPALVCPRYSRSTLDAAVLRGGCCSSGHPPARRGPAGPKAPPPAPPAVPCQPVVMETPGGCRLAAARVTRGVLARAVGDRLPHLSGHAEQHGAPGAEVRSPGRAGSGAPALGGRRGRRLDAGVYSPGCWGAAGDSPMGTGIGQAGVRGQGRAGQGGLCSGASGVPRPGSRVWGELDPLPSPSHPSSPAGAGPRNVLFPSQL